MRRKLVVSFVSLVCGIVAGGAAQTMVEMGAAMATQDQLAAGAVGGGLNPATYTGRAQAAVQAANMSPAFGATAPVPNPSAGFPALPPMGAPQAAGAPAPQPGTAAAAFAGEPGAEQPPDQVPGLSRPGGAPGVQPGQPPQQGAAPAVTPIPTIKVLVGRRVYCAVCGTLLDDAYYLTVPATDKEKYLDDGIHDNGVAGDDIRGNVETIKDKYIGPECNEVKKRLIAAIRSAESLYRPPLAAMAKEEPLSLYEPAAERQKRIELEANRAFEEASAMLFFGYHVCSVNPVTDNKAFPNILEKEKQRDELLRDWNNKFLAAFRVDKDNPQSDFLEVYVPEPPPLPRYPFPPGYVPLQKRAGGTQQPGQPQATPNIYNGDAVLNVPGERPQI
jgi:hypothetical protein